MFAPMAHFSLTEVTDPRQHRIETELQQLYHWPELISQSGVAWGESWMHDADCAAATTIRHPDQAIHYAAMYWLRAPAQQSARGFLDHFARASELGLGSRPWSRSAFDGFMAPLKGYVRPDRLVSEDALPFRPSKGAYLQLSRFSDHRGVEAEAAYHWYDQVRIPDLLACPGAVGAWTFASRELFSPAIDARKPIARILLVYLESDPVDFASLLTASERSWSAAGRTRDTSSVEDILFAGPLRTVDPWRTGAFDEPVREENV